MKVYCQTEREHKDLPLGKCYKPKCEHKCKFRAQYRQCSECGAQIEVEDERHGSKKDDRAD